MRPYHLLLVVNGLLCSLPSCAQPANSTAEQTGPLTAEVLYSTNQCGLEAAQPTAVWIDNPQSLARIYRGFPVLPSIQPPPVDFTRSGVLMIGMGQQPTAGYGLSLAEDSPLLKGETLEIRVNWQEPAPGRLLAQVLTAPCLLLKLPAVPFQQVMVIDQNGQVRISAHR
ncbi:MAG: protease complex subunit PrcB family protein [Candidatus Competibacteraceae bacterium]